MIILRPLDESIAQLEHIAGGDLTHEIRGEGDTEMGRGAGDAAHAAGAGQLRSAKCVTPAARSTPDSRELAAGNYWRSAPKNRPLRWKRSRRQHGTADLDGENERRELRAGQPTGAERVRYRQRGSDVVSRVMSKMQAITDSSRRIADIISVMDGIAFRPISSALNAAVEAARAGEQGPRFRGGGRRSAQSGAAQRPVGERDQGLIEASQNRVQEGEQMVESAAQTMSGITGEVGRVTALMREISAATREQSSGIEQVNRRWRRWIRWRSRMRHWWKSRRRRRARWKIEAQLLAQSMAVFKLPRR